MVLLELVGERRASCAMADSSVGSSTLTTWKRRVRAASFSKYFLYSAQVVARDRCAARRGPGPA